MAVKGRRQIRVEAKVEKRPASTHLQRAYKIFEQMNPQLLTARQLAALMCTFPSVAYKYIERLKRANCIEIKGGSGKVPLYGLREGASMPAGDLRGRKPRRDIDEPVAA